MHSRGTLRDSGQEMPGVSTDVKVLWWPINNFCLWHVEILDVGKKHPRVFQLLLLFLSTLSLVVYPMGYVKRITGTMLFIFLVQPLCFKYG